MIIQIKTYPITLTGDPVSEDEQCWAVYCGEPGDFEWLANFRHKEHAETFANYVALVTEGEHIVEYPE